MDLSFEQTRELVRHAIEAAHTIGEGGFLYLVDIFETSVVYEIEGPAGNSGPLYYQRSYAIVDGKVQLGDPQAVQKQVAYIPLQAASKLLAAIGNPGDENYGYEWDVQVVQYGPGSDGRINWPREPLIAAIDRYQGAKVFALNDTQHVTQRDRPMGKSVREIVGWLKDPVDTGTGINARLCILHSAKWLRDNLIDSHARGCPDLLGLSHDVTATSKNVMVGGKKMKEPVEIVAVEVDVVYSPTNNGKFIKMAAAEEPGRKESFNMETKGSTAMSPEMEKMHRMTCSAVLKAELGNSNLPAAVQDKLQIQFGGRLFEAEELQAAIKLEKEMLDKLSGSGMVTGAGDVRVTRDSGEKLQAAVDKLFGVKVDGNFGDVAAFKSLRAAYVEITGDTDVRGYLDHQQLSRLQAAYGTGTFSFVLGNTLYRRMTQDYREATDFGVSRIVGPNIRNAKDFRTLESVRIGYYGDLPDVNPEAADYPDLGELGDEEISYALNQKGGIITITRKMILNDDARAVQKIISRLPRAARRTLAKRCWGKFIGNATYKGDNKPVFHVDHGNLGSAAYGITSALAAKTAMAQQQEPESGERLMLRPVTVAFPSELYGIVKNVNDFNPQAVAIADGNMMFGYFQKEGMIESPLMTDPNDWYMFADPAEVEILELAYLNGQQEPEMFVADNPAVGQMFVADKIQYKIRHEYECEIVDFRGAYKGVVAP